VVTTDGPVMLFVTALFVLFAIDEYKIFRWQGIVLVVGLAAYTWFTYYEARLQPKIVEDEYEHDPRQGKAARWVNIAAVITGFAGLVKGADLIVEGGVGIAHLLGVSERIIGLTIFAIGTSLPELAICVVAARRGQPDIAIGNVVGSNIFNILAVIGITATFVPLAVVQEIIWFDAPVMLAAVVLSFWILRTGHQISRREGGVLLALYLVYLTWMLW
jgi:cation:H+ antiporter